MYFVLGLFIGAVMVYSYYSTQPEKIVYKTPLNPSQKKVLALFDTNTQVSSAQVKKLLKVSDATATRHLDDLEKAGEISQIGKTGRYVYYQKI
ncbi:MAG: HTH domain-containing protein [Patescibacteria group bacterium]